MGFQSLSFLLFLTVTVCACLLAGRRSSRPARAVLCTASLVFYLSGTQPLAGLAVLALGTAVTGFAVRFMAGAHRRAVFAAAVCWHIAVLAVFKYAGFFTGGAWSIGWVPVGLSFFTFQQIWYLKAVFCGEYAPQERPGDLVLYAFFFPAVTSGPILRPGDFFPKLEAAFRPTWEDAAAGLYGICMGTVKKVLLADPLGAVVNNGWAGLSSISAPEAWTVMLCYTLQLYLDFSAYCDIAVGAGRLLGIRLPVNFRSPYRSLSVTEFWKRWHITLTDFLRECVYFPLGGSRKGAVRACVNIMAVFLISGLWHGAGWTFIIWGALHGAAQVMERLAGARTARLPKWLRWCVTFAFINVAWVFFRAPDAASALTLLGRAVTGGMPGYSGWLVDGVFASEVSAVKILFPALTPWCSELVLAVLLTGGMITVLWPRNTADVTEDFRPHGWQCAVLAALTGWAVLSFSGIATFIYSNF